MHTKIDILVLSFCCFFIGSLFAWTGSFNTKSEQVLIQFNKTSTRISLEQDAIYSFTTPFGQSEIEIKQARVRFSNSTCASKYCVNKSWLSKLQPISACVPNRISAQLLGSSFPAYDAFIF